MFYSCILFHICFLKWFWFPFQLFLQNDISLCVQLMTAWHVACGISPACISWCHPNPFSFFILFYFFIVLGLLSFPVFLFFWKVCIKGVCMCVWPRSLSCPLPSLDEGSMERMDLARRERSIVCTYFLYVVYLTCSRGEELKSKGEATVCFTPSCLWT